MTRDSDFCHLATTTAKRHEFEAMVEDATATLNDEFRFRWTWRCSGEKVSVILFASRASGWVHPRPKNADDPMK